MQQTREYIRERELPDKRERERERERKKYSVSIEIRTRTLRERKWIVYHPM